MTFGWIISFLIVWSCPSIVAAFNPFLAPISQAIRQRKLTSALWGSYLAGVLRDILLSSPRLGLLGLSSLLTTAIIYRLSRLLSVEGWQGSFVVMLLSILEFFLDTLFCLLASPYDNLSFFALWSWKSLFLCTLFSCSWACVLGLCTIMVRWYKTRKLRSSSP